MSDRMPVRLTRIVAIAVLVIVALAIPLYIDEFWLRLGFAACGTAIGAIGLTALTGAAGQLSLAHAFFLAIGAVSYCVLAGDPDPLTGPPGLGWPPLLALVAAVAISALAGLIISPLSSRLSGLNLGVATLGLVFIGQHLLATVDGVTGGFEGRSAPPFEIGGLSFSDLTELTVLGVEFGAYERLWYLGLVMLAVSVVASRNLLGGRHGRAFRMVRDKELTAGVCGVDVRRVKRQAFVFSSAMAGLSGVMFALLIGSVAPVSFTLEVSIQYLVMIVIGGMGSVGGAVLGAVFVTALPILLQRYAGHIPMLGESLSPASAARYLYGLAVLLVLVLEPRGLSGIGARLARRATSSQRVGADTPTPSPIREAAQR